MKKQNMGNAWIIRARPNTQARLRLFCFTYAGGGTAFFNSWVSKLPDSVELCPIRMPGRESRLREKAFTDIAALIPPLVAALQTNLDRPFAFFGHSMGAIVAFETARYLRRHGLSLPKALIVSGCRAPQLPDLDTQIHALSDADFIEGIKRLNGTPAGVLENRELVQLLLPLLRADFQAIETYQYIAELPLAMPIVAFSGDSDPKATKSEVATWHTQTTASFLHHQLAGDHFFIHEAAFPDLFSAEIRKLI